MSGPARRPAPTACVIPIRIGPRAPIEALMARVWREIGVRPIEGMVAGFNRSTQRD